MSVFFPDQQYVLKYLSAINRLDRLTSGLMIIPLSAECARELTTEFVAGTVQKEYVARCKGYFSELVGNHFGSCSVLSSSIADKKLCASNHC